jgi:hypothetical protein
MVFVGAQLHAAKLKPVEDVRRRAPFADRQPALPRHDVALHERVDELETARAVEPAHERRPMRQPPGAEVDAAAQPPVERRARRGVVVVAASIARGAQLVVEKCRVHALVPLRRVDRAARPAFHRGLRRAHFELMLVAVERDARAGDDARDVDAFVRTRCRERGKHRDVDAPLLEHAARQASYGVPVALTGRAGLEGDLTLVGDLLVDGDVDQIGARQQPVAGGEYGKIRAALSAAQLQEGRIEGQLLLRAHGERLGQQRRCQRDTPTRKKTGTPDTQPAAGDGAPDHARVIGRPQGPVSAPVAQSPAPPA